MENTNLPSNENPKPVKKRTVPTKETDLADVAKKVSAKWTSTPAITLIWTTSSAFATDVAAFSTTLTSRRATGSKKTQYANAIALLDEKIDDHLIYIKNAITDKYKKQAAPTYFPQFGIEHKNKRHELPKDQNSRLEALKLMNLAIVEHGFAANEFGSAFWGAIQSEYDVLLGLASTTDGTVSKKVGDKNVLKQRTKNVLNSLIYVIKGNYPKTYAEELRDWGFQKEKY